MLINQSGGASLFNNDGSSTKRLTQINQELSAIFQAYVNTEHFIAALLEHHLLMALELNVSCDNGEDKTIKGLYSINEQQLSQLSVEQKSLFIDRGYYPPIMAMLASLEQVNRMVKLYNIDDTQAKITAVQLKVIQ